MLGLEVATDGRADVLEPTDVAVEGLESVFDVDFLYVGCSFVSSSTVAAFLKAASLSISKPPPVNRSFRCFLSSSSRCFASL